MTHLAGQPRGPEVVLDADYVVVGSGAGGANIAVTLARGGASVVIVEAGPWRDPHDYPSSAYGGMRDLFDEWGSTFTRGRAIWPIVQARVVGGTTVINSAICVRTPGDVFARWERERGIPIQPMADAVARHQDALEAELCVEVAPPGAVGRNNALPLQGASILGYESALCRRYVKACVGSGQCLSGCVAARKQSMNVNFVPEVLRRGGTVVSNAPVKRVLTEGTRATGVTGWFKHPESRKWGAKFTVRARRAVVVAASATHSPALLQRSGIRSPALGADFRAHPGTAVFGCYDDVVDLNTGATQGWASMAFRDDPGVKLESLAIPAELVAGRLSGGGAQWMERLRDYRHLALWVHATRAESTGTVTNGWGDRPVVRYTLDTADMARFRAGMVLIARTHFAAGAKAVLPGIHGLPYRLGPDELCRMENAPLDPRLYVGILSHLFGGCTMGTNPANSVCDPWGRVHGWSGLVVADASTIPSNLGVNPQHTIMALARIWGERLLDARSSGIA